MINKNIFSDKINYNILLYYIRKMEEQAPLSNQIKSEKKFMFEENNKKYEIILRLNDSSIDINLKDVNSFPQLN